ncbi:MAG: hypothetical protein EHM93_13355 [Bacteroidales bacterium]|nr:MAG: hypothetical protein EHM93_13355 [Bacteroidales bacterium]
MSKIQRNKKDNQETASESFFKFMLQKEQKYQVIAFIALYFILYYVITYLNPYPASISDSGAYVNAALSNRIDTYRPFGYSQFLISIHKWSTSIHFVVAVQYLINAISSLLLIFSIKYFFQPKSKFTFYLFAILAIFSPLCIYLTNTVLSDSLFSSLTVIWVTTGLWILFDRNNFHKYFFYAIHLILLFYLINIRYTGLVYLPITILLLFLTFYRRNIYISLILSVIPIILVYGYYNKQKAKIYDLIRVDTFSGFSGWQLANNALHCIPYVDLDLSGIKDKQVKEFAEIAVQLKASLELKSKPTAKFMWDKTSPLKLYCYYECDRTNSPYIYQWNYLGENVYSKFGSYVIMKHPLTFAKNYLIPNLWTALYPVHDQIVKRFRIDGIPDERMRDWFKLPASEKVYVKSKVFENYFFLIPISRLIIWIVVLGAFVLYLIKRKQMQWQPYQHAALWLILIFTSIYLAFNVYASPFELRYIAPIHLMQLSIIYIVINTFRLNIHKRTHQKV